MIENRLANVKGKYRLHIIIEALEKNRDTHVEEYGVAVTEYRRIWAEKLARAREQLEHDDIIPQLKEFNFNLAPPINKKDMYEETINLFRRMATDWADEDSRKKNATIEMTMIEADAIFNDNWEWVVAAKATNMMYAASASRR